MQGVFLQWDAIGFLPVSIHIFYVCNRNFAFAWCVDANARLGRFTE